MSDKNASREGWANLIGSLIKLKAGGNQTQFARLVGINVRTVRRWLDGDVDISLWKMLDVARVAEMHPTQLLIAAKIYSPEDGCQSAEEPASPDEESRIIRAAQVDDDTKQALLQRVAELRERDKLHRIDDIEFSVRIANTSGTARRR